MNASYKQALHEFDIDYETALERIAGNEQIYLRLLQKFLVDTNFPCLKKCLEANNYSEAFQYAHTFKGVVGNLGFTQLFRLIQPILELLRNNQSEGIQELLLPLEQAYQNICDVIREYS